MPIFKININPLRKTNKFLLHGNLGWFSMEMSSPNKRLKTLAQSPIIHPTDSKGESEIQSLTNGHENEHEPSMDCCGICLSEGVISRGFIDSCNHYFCFICIMEWAKVESKCPLCKRRFSTIRRPPKPPLFHSERLVRVPVRDQVCSFPPFLFNFGAVLANYDNRASNLLFLMVISSYLG